MIYYKKISLICEDEIRRYAIGDIERNNINLKFNEQIQIRHKMPSDLEEKINRELSDYNIPNIRYAVSYIRKRNNFQGIHIDGDKSGIIYSAINIPLKGCNKSYHIWYAGNYKTRLVESEKLSYHYLQWITEPKEDARLIIDSPYIVRVDRPHSALSTNEDRWVFTMRFINNPKFEELIKNGTF